MIATHNVVVLDLGLPRFKFLSWFMKEAGIASNAAASVPEALDLLDAGATDTVVVNSTAAAGDVAAAVTSLHHADPRPLVVTCEDSVQHDAIGADLNIAHVLDVDDVIAPLTRFLDAASLRRQDAAEPDEAAAEMVSPQTCATAAR